MEESHFFSIRWSQPTVFSKCDVVIGYVDNETKLTTQAKNELIISIPCEKISPPPKTKLCSSNVLIYYRDGNKGRLYMFECSAAKDQ